MPRHCEYPNNVSLKKLFYLKSNSYNLFNYSFLKIEENVVLLRPGKSYTVSSLRIPQGLIAARVVGCSGAM